jgi:ankyrin repeat protein
LEAGAQADAVTSEGESAIFTAIASHSDVISVLLRAGASLSLRNRYNETVAHLAAYHGPLSLLPVLMDAGVEMTARSTTSSTILHRAAEAGHLDTIQWILQHTGLAADEANDYGWTPLHFAVTGNHPSAVKFLVEQGADVAAVTRIPKNASALHLAAYFSGADVKVSIADETALLSYLLAQGTIDVSARADESLLIGGFIATQRDVSVLAGASGPGEMLLEHFYMDSESGGQDQDQVTPLDCAAEIGSIPKVQLLLAAGADINAQSPGKGWTVLHREAEPDAMMRFLIQNGADVRIKDHQGHNAVHFLCYYYRAAKPIRDLLVETGVYTEDLEGDMDWRVVAPLMKGVRRFSAVHFR